MKYHYEVVKYDENLPGKILMQHKPGYRCNTFLHWHKELEFVYMIDGELDAKIGGKEVRINSGDFYFCNSEEIHITSAPDEKKTVKYVVVLLSYDYLRSFHKAIDRYQFKIAEAHKAVIADLLRRIVSIKESDEQYMDISLNIMLLELYRYLLENCTAEKESMLPTNVPENFIYAKQAIEYVEKNYKNDISMKSVADIVGLSPTYFSKYFKNVADVSFIRYLNLVRLEHALNDMFYDNQNVTNAAMNNGFANVKSFIELCKKSTVTLPQNTESVFCPTSNKTDTKRVPRTQFVQTASSFKIVLCPSIIEQFPIQLKNECLARSSCRQRHHLKLFCARV